MASRYLRMKALAERWDVSGEPREDADQARRFEGDSAGVAHARAH